MEVKRIGRYIRRNQVRLGEVKEIIDFRE